MNRISKLVGTLLISACVLGSFVLPAHAQQVRSNDAYIPADIARQSLFQATADTLHISEDDLLAQLTGDKSLQDVIAADGGNVAAIEQQAHELEGDKVNALVSSGLLDKSQADHILDSATKALDNGMIKDHTLAAQELQDRLSRQSLLQAAAKATGLTDEQIADQLAAGKTFAQIIHDHGGKVEDVEKAAQEQFKDGVTNLVKNGDLPQSQADKVVNGFDRKMDFQLRQDTTLHDRVRRDIITDHALFDATVKATGLTPDQVRDRLAKGGTFDQIIRDNGGNVEAVQKAAGEQIRAVTQKLVKNGVIGHVQADYLTHNLDKRLDYAGHHTLPHHHLLPKSKVESTKTPKPESTKKP